MWQHFTEQPKFFCNFGAEQSLDIIRVNSKNMIRKRLECNMNAKRACENFMKSALELQLDSKTHQFHARLHHPDKTQPFWNIAIALAEHVPCQ